MLCTSREEHEELFGDSENYDGDDDFDFQNRKVDCNECIDYH